jgi:hypothetical protein
MIFKFPFDAFSAVILENQGIFIISFADIFAI